MFVTDRSLGEAIAAEGLLLSKITARGTFVRRAEINPSRHTDADPVQAT